MVGPVVLCVDGEANILQSLQRALRREPYAVITVTSAAAAERVLLEHGVQVVMADARLPDMTPAAFWQMVADRAPEAVGMVLTGRAELPDLVEAVNIGHVHYFLSKPWDNDALRAAILACLDEGWRRGAGLPARLLEELPLPVLLLNDEGGVRYVNRAGRRRLKLAVGGSADSLPGPLAAGIVTAMRGGRAWEGAGGQAIPVMDERRRPGCLVVVTDKLLSPTKETVA